MPHRIFPGTERGQLDLGWLRGQCSFSYGSWDDPNRLSFATLRALNEYRLAPSHPFQGQSAWAYHTHFDHEIITLVRAGELLSEDMEGGSVQLIAPSLLANTAGRGIGHSQGNPSLSTPTQLVEIWLLPRADGLPPARHSAPLCAESCSAAWTILAQPDTLEEPVGQSSKSLPLPIAQDAWVAWRILGLGQADTWSRRLAANGLYVHVLAGTVDVPALGVALVAGDGLALTESEAETIALQQAGDLPAEVLLLDLPLMERMPYPGLRL
jgi:redox-sensitive bicupin YhaK (pirin superfamily)